jgi:hypothetical protein
VCSLTSHIHLKCLKGNVTGPSEGSCLIGWYFEIQTPSGPVASTCPSSFLSHINLPSSHLPLCQAVAILNHVFNVTPIQSVPGVVLKRSVMASKRCRPLVWLCTMAAAVCFECFMVKLPFLISLSACSDWSQCDDCLNANCVYCKKPEFQCVSAMGDNCPAGDSLDTCCKKTDNNVRGNTY